MSHLSFSAANLRCLEIFLSHFCASVPDPLVSLGLQAYSVEKYNSLRLLPLLPSSPLLSSNEVPRLRKPTSCWWHQLCNQVFASWLHLRKAFPADGESTTWRIHLSPCALSPQDFLWSAKSFTWLYHWCLLGWAAKGIQLPPPLLSGNRSKSSAITERCIWLCLVLLALMCS